MIVFFEYSLLLSPKCSAKKVNKAPFALSIHYGIITTYPSLTLFFCSSPHQATVAVNYMKAINFLFMGGLMMAIAVENSGLHRRISLSLLMGIGTSPVLIMLSFMVTTAFLSMWISNTASTAMMIPIVEAVVRTIDGAEGRGRGVAVGRRDRGGGGGGEPDGKNNEGAEIVRT